MDVIKSTNRDVHIYYVEMLFTKPKWTLRCCGTWPYDSNWLYTFLALTYLGISITVIIWQHVFIFFNHDEFDYIIGAYSTMFPIVIVVYKQIFLLHHRKTYIRLLDIVKNDFWPLNSLDDDMSIQNMFKTLNKFFTFYLFSIIISAQVWMVFPFIDHLPGHRKMPIVCWYPFDIDRSPIYEIVYFTVIATCLHMSMSLYGYDYMFFQFTTHVCVQYKLLQKCLQSINKRFNSTSPESSDEHEKYIYDEFVFCVKHHILLKRFYEDMARIFNANNGLQVLINCSELVALMYLVRYEQDPERLIKLFLYIIVVAIEIGMYCIAGTVLEEASLSVSYAAFEGNWYDARPQLRLGIMRFIQMSHVPLRLSSYGMVYINNPFYVTIWKTAFSMSTLILNMRTKQKK